MDPNANTIDPAQLLAWLKLHQWVPIIAVVVGLLVRLVKDDTKLAGSLPSWFRPYFALILSAMGVAAGGVLGGIPWQSAIEQTLMAFATAVLGHHAIVEGLRGGKEIPVPGLTKSPAQMDAEAVPIHEVSSPPDDVPPPPMAA
jgi:uncharacterized membrane protein